jgi:hypothetical protein
MDRIYRDAYLTIIASSGNGPHHGLPGVSITPRLSLDRTTIGGCTLVDPKFTQLDIETSVWNTRGWTYQEAVLSCRCLVFTQSQVYFECQNMVRLESATLELPSRVLFKEFLSVGYEAFYVYANISKYWEKQLTFESDRINAIQGILTAYEGKQRRRQVKGHVLNTHFWGIPVFSNNDWPQTAERSSFKQGLLFTYRGFRPDENARSRTFPTWSWAGRSETKRSTLDFEYIYRDFISKWSSSLIYATHKLGQSVEIGKFTGISQDYKDFLPHLHITSWTLWATLNDWSDKDLCIHKGTRPYEENMQQYLDYNECDRNKETLLVHVDTYTWYVDWVQISGLLLEETTPRTFRRVGIWRATCAVKWENMTDDEFFTEYFKPDPAVTNKKWEKRTVRII